MGGTAEQSWRHPFSLSCPVGCHFCWNWGMRQGSIIEKGGICYSLRWCAMSQPEVEDCQHTFRLSVRGCHLWRPAGFDRAAIVWHCRQSSSPRPLSLTAIASCHVHSFLWCFFPSSTYYCHVHWHVLLLTTLFQDEVLTGCVLGSLTATSMTFCY